MPLPDDFNPYQHLLEQLIVTHNRRVLQAFHGVEANDISTSLGAMRTAVFITEDDTIDMIMLRMFLFHFKFRKDLPAPIFGIPAADYQADVTYRPIVKLFFIEPYTEQLALEKLNQATAEISFRLYNETSQTINREKVIPIANRIKEFFGQGMGFTFMKGKTKVMYTDKRYALQLAIYAENKTEGIRVVRRVLEVAGHPFDEEFIRTTTIDAVYPNVPGMQQVYGMEVRKPRKKPVTRVRFSRAELHVWGLDHAISLVDLSRKTYPLVA